MTAPSRPLLRSFLLCCAVIPAWRAMAAADTFATGTSWNTDANWSLGLKPTASDNVVIGRAVSATLGIDGSALPSVTVQDIDNTSTASIILENSSGVAGNPSVLTLNGGRGAGVPLLTTGANLFTIRNGTTNTLGLQLGATGSFNVGAGGMTISSVISETGGAQGFTKAGAGTLTLSGANTYTGKTTVNAGTLSFNTIGNVGGGASALGNPATAADGTIDFTGNATITYTGGAASSDRAISIGSGLTGTFFNSGTGALTLSGGTTGAGTLSLRGAQNFTLSGLLAHTGQLRKTEDMTVTLTNSGNSYAGETAINKGAFSITQIADSGVNSQIGSGSTIRLGQTGFNNTGTLRFNGPSGGSSNRAIIIESNTGNTNGGVIENTVAGQTLTLSGGVTIAGSGTTPSLQLIGAGNGVMSGVIAGTGLTVTKSGAGTWTLSNSNTYTGDNSIAAGTLAVTQAVNLGLSSSTSAITFPSGSTGVLAMSGSAFSSSKGVTLTGSGQVSVIGGADTATLSGVVSGAGAFTKLGAGTLTLSGVNTNTGTINVREGVLQLTGARTAQTGAITVGSNTGQAGTLNISNGAFNVGGDFGVGNVDNTVDGVVNQTGGTLTMTSGNRLLISRLGSRGTYNLSGGTVLGGAASTTRGLIIGVNTGSAGTFNLSGTGVLDLTGTNLQVARSENTTATGASGAFVQTGGTAIVGSLGVGGNTAGNNANNVGVMTFTGGTFTAGSFNGFAGGNNSSATINIGGTAVVTLPALPVTRGTGATSTMTFDGGTLVVGAASATWISNLSLLQLRNNGAVIDTAGLNSTIAQGVNHSVIGGDNAIDGGLTKNGLGTLTLSAAGNYTGPTVVNLGTLAISNASSLGTTASGTTVNGGNGTNGAGVSLSGGITVAEPLTLLTSAAGRANLTSSGNNQWSGPISVTTAGNNLAQISSSSGTFTVSGNITGVTSSTGVLFFRGAANGVVTGDIDLTPSSVVAKTDDGTWTIGAAGKTYDFGTYSNARGTTRLGGDNLLPANLVLTVGQSSAGAENALFNLNGYDQTVASLTSTLGPGGTKAVTSDVAGSALTVNNASTVTYSGQFTGGANLELVKAGAGEFITTGAFSAGTATVNQGTLTVNSATGDAFAPTGGLVVNGGGTLKLGGAGKIQDNTLVSVAGGGTFNLNGFADTVGHLTGAGSVVTGGGLTLAGTASPTTQTFSGVLSGAGNLTVASPGGTQVLSNPANTFTGKTAVDGGTLEIPTGSEATLGNPAAAADALSLGGGTLRITTASLTVNDAGRGVKVNGSGVVDVDNGITFTLGNALDATSASLHKNGAGTFDLTAGATVFQLTVNAGRLRQSSGNISAGTATIGAGGTYQLAGGNLRVDNLVIDGEFEWTNGVLTHQTTTTGSPIATDVSSPGYQNVGVGRTATVTGDLVAGTGSVLALHASPTLYLSGGVRFNNFHVDGNLNLLAGGDILELELNPYLLRPFAQLGPAVIETGSLPLVTWTGVRSGEFEPPVGILNDGRGFALSAFPVSDPTSLDPNTYWLEYDDTAKTLFLHYSVAGYVPEPGSFGLLAAGVAGLRLARRLASRRREIAATQS